MIPRFLFPVVNVSSAPAGAAETTKKLCREMNAASRQKRAADDAAHVVLMRQIAADAHKYGPFAAASERRHGGAPAPGRTSPAESWAEGHAKRTDAARQLLLGEAVAGDPDAIVALRTSSWFPDNDSAAHHVGHRQSDAAIAAAAGRYLQNVFGVTPAKTTTATVAPRFINTSALYAARNSPGHDETNPPAPAERPRSFAALARQVYSAAGHDGTLIGASSRGGGA